MKNKYVKIEKKNSFAFKNLKDDGQSKRERNGV